MIAGFWMHWGAMKEGYFYLGGGGGSGYTLSKKALKAFVEGPLQTCNVKYNSSEQDVWFTKCARILTKNNFIYTRDASGAHRYHQMPVQLHATHPKIKFDNYEKDYIAYLVNESLHYLRSNFMKPLVYMGDYISKSSIAFTINHLLSLWQEINSPSSLPVCHKSYVHRQHSTSHAKHYKRRSSIL